MTKPKITVREAHDYLADLVEGYILDGFPLQHLTGQEGGGQPERRHLRRLREALLRLGYERAADMLPADAEGE